MTNWQNVLQETGAIWIHDGKAARPHALLTSGLHSDGFVNNTLVTQTPALVSRILSADDGLAAKLPKEKIDWVIGSAYGAVTFAFAVAEKLGANAGFTEKDGEAMKLARFEVKPGEKVLVVEDTISTGGSTLKSLDGIRKTGVKEEQILPYIICLVNRSGSDVLAGHEIRPLVKLNIHNWQPNECPLCAKGSKAVRPKSNWNELVRSY